MSVCQLLRIDKAFEQNISSTISTSTSQDNKCAAPNLDKKLFLPPSWKMVQSNQIYHQDIFLD